MDRKIRLEYLLQKQKRAQRISFGQVFDECIEALGVGTRVLSECESKRIYDYLQSSFPFTRWGRIDWEAVTDKQLISEQELLEKELQPLKQLSVPINGCSIMKLIM